MLIANFLNSSEVTTDRLFQWDIGQQIQLLNLGETIIAPNVHFCNKKSDNALVVQSKLVDDSYIANIPNSLLAEEYDITAFIYLGNDEEAKTIKVVHIPVTKRIKPSSYIYSDDKDVVDFMAVSSEIHSLLAGLVITPYDNTKNYIKPNIVYYQGSTYICKSETTITDVLPTNSDVWGLMCKHGANINEITFSNDTLHFKLESNDILDVSLNTIELTTVPNDEIISKKILLWSGIKHINDHISNALDVTTYNLSYGDKIELVIDFDYMPNGDLTVNPRGGQQSVIMLVGSRVNVTFSGSANGSDYYIGFSGIGVYATPEKLQFDSGVAVQFKINGSLTDNVSKVVNEIKVINLVGTKDNVNEFPQLLKLYKIIE